ncbi:MAG: N-formylglutamate amidohydrolase [Pyrinomonadaceae bacterium]|nr:N-formylglutamate amidohydrolase [Phycisphaerales bacterium]
MQLLLTCEHATNRVPARFAPLFHEHQTLLSSHRGYDPGALMLARFMQRSLKSPLLASTVSRLLIENNRSLHHRNLFSLVTRELDDHERDRIIRQYYTPHRSAVVDRAAAMMREGRTVLHVGVHSFTPVLNGEVRRADIGLLFDPRRRLEASICRTWQARLEASLPGMVIRRNYPYKGISDGLTTSLRKQFPAGRYLGVELEVNSKHLTGGTSPARAALCAAISRTLEEVLHC